MVKSRHTSLLLVQHDSANAATAQKVALQRAVETGAEVVVAWCVADRLSHYGEVDHLAPETAKEEFVNYVYGNHLVQAQECLAGFITRAKRLKLEVRIVVLPQEPLMTLLDFASSLRPSLVILDSYCDRPFSLWRRFWDRLFGKKNKSLAVLLQERTGATLLTVSDTEAFVSHATPFLGH